MRKVTPVSQKILTIVSNRFCLNADSIQPDTTFEQLNINSTEKYFIIDRICEKFRVKVPEKKETINNLWDMVTYIEATDGFDGKPAGWNTSAHNRD